MINIDELEQDLTRLSTILEQFNESVNEFLVNLDKLDNAIENKLI